MLTQSRSPGNRGSFREVCSETECLMSQGRSNLDSQEHKTQSSLFLVRLWLLDPGDHQGDGQGELSGRVIHIVSGRACNFVRVTTLGPLLIEMLLEATSDKEAKAPDAIP